MLRKLFSNDLANSCRRKRLPSDAEMRTQSFVDQSLVSLAALLRELFEVLDYCLVQQDRDTRLPGLPEHTATFAF